MKINTLRYYFLAGMKSLKRNKALSIILVISISSAFFIMGIFALYLILIDKNAWNLYSTEFRILIKYIEVVIFIILPPALLFLIVNQIKIVILERKDEICTMKLLGADDWFILWPFIIQGVVIGIISAGIADLIINFIYTKLIIFEGVLTFIDSHIVSRAMFIIFIVSGILLEFIGNIIAFKKAF